LAACLERHAGREGVPASLAESTIETASALLAGKGVGTDLISAKAAALAEDMLQSMRMTELKNVLTFLTKSPNEREDSMPGNPEE
jgi:hypothetical protein